MTGQHPKIELPPRRVTIKDIATEAGVHFSTVSLALRNSPRVAASTQKRIQDLADQLGYQPDPYLDAFNFQRSSGQETRALPSIALVWDATSSSEKPTRSQIAFCNEIKNHCERSGYFFESFTLGRQQLSLPRLNKILASRGANGLILCSLGDSQIESHQGWSELSCLKLESQHSFPELDCISPNHRRATRIAYRELRKRGCRRIGMALDLETARHSDSLHEVGYLLEVSSEPSSLDLAPFLYGRADLGAPTLSQQLGDWIEDSEIDAVISPSEDLLDLLGERKPSLKLASLNRSPVSRYCGMELGYPRLAASAVKLLAHRIQLNLHGPHPNPTLLLAPVEWVASDERASRADAKASPRL